MPARIIGEKTDTGAVIELLLLKNIENDNWEVLAKPAKRIKVGTIISFGNGMLKAKCTEEGEEGIRIVTFDYNAIFYELLDKLELRPIGEYTLHRRPVSYAKMYEHLGCRLYNKVTADNGVTRYCLCYNTEKRS